MENEIEIIKKDDERIESTGRQRDGAKDGANQKIILFIIGVLVGAVISTGAFLVYIKVAGVDSSNNSSMQGGPGGTPPEMPSGSSSSGQSGQPPAMPGSNSSSSSSSSNTQSGNS